MQFFSVPLSFVQVQQPFGLQRKLRVAREDPTAVLPRSDGILVQPTPDGTAADGRHQPRASCLTGQFRRTPAGEWHPMLARQFTRHGLHGHNHVRGKKTWAVQGVGVLRVLVAVPQRSACATDSRPLGAYRASSQSRRCSFLGRPSKSSWRAVPQKTATYTSPSAVSTPAPLFGTARLHTGCVLAYILSFKNRRTIRQYPPTVNIIRYRIYGMEYLGSCPDCVPATASKDGRPGPSAAARGRVGPPLPRG